MQVLLSADRLQVRIAEMAKEIARDYEGRPVTIVGVLTGCLMFLADLVRHLDLRLRIDFVQASSYRGETTTAGELSIDPATLAGHSRPRCSSARRYSRHRPYASSPG